MKTHTYRNNLDVAQAFVHNCRGGDLLLGDGIMAGTILRGKHGLVITERYIPRLVGNTETFKANGKCCLGNHWIDCMYVSGTPRGKSLRGLNYIVAELKTTPHRMAAAELRIPIIPDSRTGRLFVNLELDRFPGQSVNRRTNLK